MTNSAKVLRYTAFALMVLFGALGSLFLVGETFADPGGWTAVGMVLAWAGPMLALIAYAVLRKERAGAGFVVVSLVVGAFTLLDETVGIVPSDYVGPVATVTVFSLGVALAFLGLHRSALAGILMVALAAVQFGALVLGAVVRGGLGDGPPISAMLGGSSGVVVLPLLVIGSLFLIAGLLGQEPLSGRVSHMRLVH